MRAYVRWIALAVACRGGLFTRVVAAPARQPAPVTNLELATGSPGAAPADGPSSPSSPSSPVGAVRPPGATLVLNSLSEAARIELARTLGRLAAALGRRRNPLFVPLDDGVERTLVETLLRDTGPAFAVAGALSAERWASSEGDLTVRGVRRCAPEAPCIHLGLPTERSDLERRALFLAWPIGFAIVVRSTHPRDAIRIAAAVRDSRSNDSHIALVLTGAELHSLRKSPAATEIARNAAGVLLAGGDRNEALAGILASIVNAASASDEVPWLTLPEGALLIVPRLGALATPDAFVQEVSALLDNAGGHVTWLMSPRPRP
jgi:hypothetical protein